MKSFSLSHADGDEQDEEKDVSFFMLSLMSPL